MSSTDQTLSQKIAEKEKEREIIQSRNQQLRDQQRQQELEKAQKDFDKYQQELEALESEQRELERQQSEIDNARLTEEQKKRDIEANKAAIQQKYDAQSKKLIQEREAYFSGGRNKLASQSVIRNINDKIKNLEAQKRMELSQYDFSLTYGNTTLPASVAKRFESSGGRESLTSIYEAELLRRESQAQQARTRSIAQAQSNAVIERQQYEQRIKDLEKQKIETQSKESEMIRSIQQRYGLTPATRQDPKPMPIQDKNIFSPDVKALETQEEAIFEKREASKQELQKIESRQKELSQKLAAAKSKEEAKQVLESYKDDSAVGTVKTIEYRGQVKQTSGVIVEPMTDPTYAQQKQETEKTKLEATQTRTILGPPSIFGVDVASSERAISTFEKTEKEQSELSTKLQKAKTAKEALELVKEAREKNPYVGTQVSFFTLGKQVSSEGFLIEKVLTDKIETKTTEPTTEPTKEQPKVRTHTTLQLFETLNIDDPLEGESSPGIPYYVFIDEQGKEITKPTPETLWQFARQRLDEVPDIDKLKQTKVDYELNKYYEENKTLIDAYEENPNKELGTSNPIVDTTKDTFQAGFLGHTNEISAAIKNTMNPEKQIEARPTLETLALFDVVEQGQAYFENIDRGLSGKEPVKYGESESYKMVIEKTRTPAGVEYLAGTVAGSVVAAAATVVIPPLAGAKYGKYVILPKTYREAKKVAEKIFSNEPDRAFIEARLKEQYPTMPEKVRKETVDQIVAKTKPTEPTEPILYNVEMLTPRTALITSGTEATESKVIVYRSGRNAVTSIYEAADESAKLELREIIIKGVQSGEFDEGKLIASSTQKRNIESQSVQIIGRDEKGNILVKGTDKLKPENIETLAYPLTPENLAKIQDPAIQNYLKIIGTRKDVPTSILQRFPQRVIESVANEEVKTAAGIYETQNLSRARSASAEKLEKDVMGKKLTRSPIGQKGFEYETKDLPPAGSLVEKQERQAKRFKADTEEINLNLPKDEDLNFGIPTTRTGPRTTEIAESPQAPKETTGKLADIARETVKSETGLTYGGYYTSSGLRVDVEAMTGEINLNLQDTGLGLEEFTFQGLKLRPQQKQAQKQQSSQLMDQDISLELKQENFLEEIAISRERITEKQKQMPKLGPRFSLVVIPDETTDEGQRFRIIEVQKEREELIEKFKIMTDIEYPPTETTVPGVPDIPAFLLPKGIKEKDLIESGLKLKSFYFAWNVNTDVPGAYLATKDLRVGRTSKVIKTVERIQRRQNAPKYQRQVQRREQKAVARPFGIEEEEKRTRRRKPEKTIFQKSFKELTERKKGGKFRVRF